MERSMKGVCAVFAAWVLACRAGAAAGADARSSVSPADLEASPIARLAKAIEDGDARTVAAFVRYPLEREVPLPPIGNPHEFVARFPVLFDEAFLQQMKEGRFSEDWAERDWRGVAYRGGELWVDGTMAGGGRIYSVNYQSEEERRQRAALVEAERATLPPVYAAICAPVFCFQSDDGEISGRVDRNPDGSFRVMLYDGPGRSGRRIPRGTGVPYEIFQATKVVEGSGGNHVYLDQCGRFAVEVDVIAALDAPDLILHERLFWSDAFEKGRPLHYASWEDLIAPPEPTAAEGDSAP